MDISSQSPKLKWASWKHTTAMWYFLGNTQTSMSCWKHFQCKDLSEYICFKLLSYGYSDVAVRIKSNLISLEIIWNSPWGTTKIYSHSSRRFMCVQVSQERPYCRFPLKTLSMHIFVGMLHWPPTFRLWWICIQIYQTWYNRTEFLWKYVQFTPGVQWKYIHMTRGYFGSIQYTTVIFVLKFTWF